MKTKIIIISAFSILILPALASAKGNLSVVRESGSEVSMEGECSEKVKIELFKKADDSESAFAKDVSCQNGKFYFSENLSQKNVTEGSYVVAVDGEKSLNMVAVREGFDTANKNSKTAQIENIETADTKFLGAFVALQQSILDMQTWLAETAYPQVVKDSLGLALDGLQLATGKITELLWSTDSDDNSIDIETPAIDDDVRVVESAISETEAQVSAENLQILPEKSVEPQAEQQLEILENSISTGDGLNIEENK